MKSSFLNMNWQLSKHLLINRKLGSNIKTNVLEGAKKTAFGYYAFYTKSSPLSFPLLIQNDIYSLYFYCPFEGKTHGRQEDAHFEASRPISK